jgi:predicted nucleotidyltransferase
VPVGFFKFIELEEHLKKLGAKVDFVTPDALKPLIKPQVMKEAVYKSSLYSYSSNRNIVNK